MRSRTVSLLFAVVLFVQSHVPAHATYERAAKCLDRFRDCRWVQKAIHEIWKTDHATEHRAAVIFGCESGLKQFSRRYDGSTQYKGILSAGSGFRASYPVWSWHMRDQITAAWQAYQDSGFAHWGEGQDWGCA